MVLGVVVILCAAATNSADLDASHFRVALPKGRSHFCNAARFRHLANPPQHRSRQTVAPNIKTSHRLAIIAMRAAGKTAGDLLTFREDPGMSNGSILRAIRQNSK